MPQVPRIRRTEPTSSAVRPLEPLPVTVTLIWHDGASDETDADAVAWTPRGRDRVDHPMGRHPPRLGQRQPGPPAQVNLTGRAELASAQHGPNLASCQAGGRRHPRPAARAPPLA